MSEATQPETVQLNLTLRQIDHLTTAINIIIDQNLEAVTVSSDLTTYLFNDRLAEQNKHLSAVIGVIEEALS